MDTPGDVNVEYNHMTGSLSFVFGCRMSHPVTNLNASFMTVNNGGGTVEGVSPAQSSGQLCGAYEV